MTARIPRCLIPLLALGAIAAPAASAQAPLAGTGENIQPIARVPIPHPNEVELAGDWAFVSSDGSESYTPAEHTDAGLVIVNIKDPAHPFIEGKWVCDAGWGDIDLSPDANIAVLTNAHGDECTDGGAQVAILDVSDKKNPKLLSTISDDEMPYVHTVTLDNGGKTLYLNPQAAAFYPQGTEPHIAVWDISDPKAPARKTFISKTGIGLAHDTYVDHRPDGKTLMYAASIHTSDVFDITDIMKPVLLQQMTSPEISISHDVQPNHDRSMIIVDDEGAAGGQLDEGASACGKIGGPGPAGVDSGSVHFYAANADGTFLANGAAELGSWNAPANANEGACVAHVFWQAPDQNRLSQAYYRMGAFVLDFDDPLNVKMLASFQSEQGADYWSNKPHRGYLFATDQDGAGAEEPLGGGLDILRYTGEQGKAWPATSGPAEVQRSARQGVPYVPLTLGGQPVGTAPLPGAGAGPDTRPVGRVKFKAKLKKVAGKKGKKTKVTFTFVDAAGKKVGTASVKKAAGKKAKVTISGGAVAGKYKWTAKAGKKVLGRGKFTVKKSANAALAPSKRLSVRAK
jgi:hypothetical protein